MENLNQIVKINKSEARKLFNQGKNIYILPCKVVLKNPWVQPMKVNNKNNEDSKIYTTQTFDQIVNNFEYYNTGSQLGYYAAYYINFNDIN